MSRPAEHPAFHATRRGRGALNRVTHWIDQARRQAMSAGAYGEDVERCLRAAADCMLEEALRRMGCGPAGGSGGNVVAFPRNS